MNEYLLDTDHLSLQEQGQLPLLQRLAAIPADRLAVSVVTVEESLRGRLAILARQLDGEARVRAYARFLESVRFFQRVNVIPFDEACEACYQDLVARRLRIGSRDLKIAATALAHNRTVVTRNRRDFGRIPGVTHEDWSVPAPGDASP
jgi:tRNA(fMet)-specific endonuclease VapC